MAFCGSLGALWLRSDNDFYFIKIRWDILDQKPLKLFSDAEIIVYDYSIWFVGYVSKGFFFFFFLEKKNKNKNK